MEEGVGDREGRREEGREKRGNVGEEVDGWRICKSLLEICQSITIIIQ